MMRVGIDGGCWSNRRGYGRFLRELLHSMAGRDDGIEYTIFLDSEGWELFDLREHVHAVHVETSRNVGGAATAGGRRSVRDVLRMSLAVARYKFDTFFFPSVYSYFPLIRPTRMLLGIHDTIADKQPEFAFASKREWRFWNWKVRLALAQANLVLTVSDYSRRSIQEHFSLGPERLRVLSEAASLKFRPAGPVNREQPYVLYVGGISPNKNLKTLIRAFTRIRVEYPKLRLILAGDHSGDSFKSSYDDLAQEIAARTLEAHVLFTGFVPEDELPSLYSGASLFAFPSLDEGFGLPVLEAMACGTPVVASRGNSLEEVVGDAGILVNPHDETDVAMGMAAVLGDAATASKLRLASLARAKEFSWDRSADQIAGVFREMGGRA
jgi:glycosyltransferase involved in cell wall biosynthesis